jgi:hypothetical protein
MSSIGIVPRKKKAAIEWDDDRKYNATAMITEENVERRAEKLRRSRLIWGER